MWGIKLRIIILCKNSGSLDDLASVEVLYVLSVNKPHIIIYNFKIHNSQIRYYHKENNQLNNQKRF